MAMLVITRGLHFLTQTSDGPSSASTRTRVFIPAFAPTSASRKAPCREMLRLLSFDFAKLHSPPKATKPVEFPSVVQFFNGEIFEPFVIHAEKHFLALSFWSCTLPGYTSSNCPSSCKYILRLSVYKVVQNKLRVPANMKHNFSELELQSFEPTGWISILYVYPNQFPFVLICHVLSCHLPLDILKGCWRRHVTGSFCQRLWSELGGEPASNRSSCGFPNISSHIMYRHEIAYQPTHSIPIISPSYPHQWLPFHLYVPICILIICKYRYKFYKPTDIVIYIYIHN